jgi:hypothetical protein
MAQSRYSSRAATRIGTLPRVGALDQLRGANGDGMVDRARSNPRLVVAIAAGAILLLAWIGWAVYVTSSNGASAGLGVVIAWPAMLLALGLISLPFIGGYLLVRRLSADGGSPRAGSEPVSEGEEESGNEEQASEDMDEEPEEEDDSEEDGDPDDESDDAEPDTEKTAG